jgi:hypothetical protein
MQAIKRVSLRSAVLSVLLASSVAFAAAPTTEPSLPTNIELYPLQLFGTCNKHPGKTLLTQKYRQVGKLVQVLSLNGEKILQIEVTQDSPLIYYVRNSPGKNWLSYSESEDTQAMTRLYAELGLTKEELASCN